MANSIVMAGSPSISKKNNSTISLCVVESFLKDVSCYTYYLIISYLSPLISAIVGHYIDKSTSEDKTLYIISIALIRFLLQEIAYTM